MPQSKFDIATQIDGVFNQTQLKIKSASNHTLNLKPNESLTANRILNLITGDADRTINLGGDLTIAKAFTAAGAFDTILRSTAATDITLPTTGTLATLNGAETLSNKTLVTPNLGTPSSLTLTNATGLPVAGGGTGIAAATAYSVICAGTTATGAFQSLSSVGSSGQVLTSNGAGALPSWQSISGGFAATQAEQEAATSTTVFVSPGRQQFHPSAAKAWVNFNGTGTVSIRSSYGVTSITDNGTGDYTINTAVTFSSTNNMAANVSVGGAGAWIGTLGSTPFTTTSVRVFSFAVDTSFQDVSFVCVSIFGDLA